MTGYQDYVSDDTLSSHCGVMQMEDEIFGQNKPEHGCFWSYLAELEAYSMYSANKYSKKFCNPFCNYSILLHGSEAEFQ